MYVLTISLPCPLFANSLELVALAEAGDVKEMYMDSVCGLGVSGLLCRLNQFLT